MNEPGEIRNPVETTKKHITFVHPFRHQLADPDINPQLKRKIQTETEWGNYYTNGVNDILDGQDPQQIIAEWAIHSTDTEYSGLAARQKYESILEQLRTDEKSSLENERALLEDLEGSKTGALLFLDLDKFKAVNDTYGHEAGDEAIQILGKIIDASLRKREDNPENPTYRGYRIHGDEFAIKIGQEITLQDLKTLAEEIVTTIAKTPLHFEGNTVQLGTSIGGTLIDGPGVMRDADISLYHAKSLGRGTSFIKGVDEPRLKAA